MTDDFPEERTFVLDEPIVLTLGAHKGVPFAELKLAHPEAGEMRRANGQIRTGPNAENMYVRTRVLIEAVTKRLGAPWPAEAVDRLPDGVFTEAENFLMGFQQRANNKTMREDMERERRLREQAAGTETSDT